MMHQQPDDPGVYARNDTPDPWWAHVLRLIDGDASRVARLLRRVRRGLASLDAWLGGER